MKQNLQLLKIKNFIENLEIQLPFIKSIIENEISNLNGIDKVANIKIEDLELSVRTINVLSNMQITKIGDFKKIKCDDLLNMPNFGKKSFQELQDCLKEFNINLEDYK